MKKVLSATFVFVALCALVAVLTLRDFEQKIRSEAIVKLSEKVGRSIVIDGEVSISYSFSPTVTIDQIKFGNAPWAEKTYMANIGRLEMQIGLMPLFRRQVEIKHLMIKDAEINLEVNSNGENNWSFFSEIKKKCAEAMKCVSTENVVENALENIHLTDFENIEVFKNNRQKNQKSKIVFNTMTAVNEKENLKLTSRLSFKEETVSLVMQGENLSALMQEKPYKFSLNAVLKETDVRIQGTLLNLFSKPQMNGDLTIRSQDASAFGKTAGISLPALEEMVITAKISAEADALSLPEFQIKAGKKETAQVTLNGTVDAFEPLSVRMQAEINAPDMSPVRGLPAFSSVVASGDIQLNGGIFLDNLKIKIGSSDLAGRILIQTDQKISIQSKLYSSQFLLSDVLGKKWDFADKTVSKQSVRKGEKVFSSQELPYDALQTAEVDVDVSVARLVGVDGTDLGPFSLKGGMHDGVFLMPSVKLAEFASMQAGFDASKKPAAAVVELKADKLPLSLFLTKEQQERGTINGNIHLSGQGNSEAQFAATVNGNIFIDVQDVFIPSFNVISVPQNLSFLSPVNQSDSLTIPCAVVNVPVKNGIIVSNKKIGMENSMLDMQMDGVLNLKEETVDLKIEVSPRSSGILKTVFNAISIKGDMADPQVNLNTNQMFDKALSIGMAYFIGGKKAAQEAAESGKLKNVCADALSGGEK